jgi:CrcB protein
MLQKIALIAVAGAFGSASRFALDSFVKNHYAGNFPLGIALVNILGCFIFGLVWSLGEKAVMIAPESRIIILTGFIGAFTTFSTLMFDTYNLANTSNWHFAILNVIIQIVAGFFSLIAGIKVASLF